MSAGELLNIEPLELQFPLELLKQVSCSLQLSNKTDYHVAFKIKTTNPKRYIARPKAAVVLPRSTCQVIVIMALREAPTDMKCRDKFMVQSVVANPGTTPEDITEEMFNKEVGKQVEECMLKAVYFDLYQSLSTFAEGSGIVKESETETDTVPKRQGRMSVLDAASSFLVDNIRQILMYKPHLIAEVRENFVELSQQLVILKGLMKDFTSYHHDTKFLKQMTNEIKSALDEAEDAIDTYILQAAVEKSRDWASRAFHEMRDYPLVLQNVVRRIAEIGNKVKRIINEENIKNGFEVLQYQDIGNLSRSANPTKAARVPEDQVIGFDRAAEEVGKLLTGGLERLEIISIVGMSGLGKTTLAKQVYKDHDLDYIFAIRAFVHVSNEYNKREVLLKILTSFTKINDPVAKMNEEQLERYLYQNLKRRSYLLVLDDVYSTKDWDKFKNVFPNNDLQCRVLITTCNTEVAEYANPRNPNSIHHLDFLNLEESRKLLRWKVFNANYCPIKIQEYEIQIAKKCNGLPLALLVAAGIVLNHPDRINWWRVVASSLQDHNARDTTQITEVIQLMYKHLPDYLKPCLLYLGIFHFEIPVWKLVRLWISEGLILNDDNFNLEIIAEQYLEELVQRNLVMVGRRSSNQRIKTYLMHDSLRAFCQAEGSKQNFYHEIKKDELFFSFSNTNHYRRLYIDNVDILGYISGNHSGSSTSIRSFLIFVEQELLLDSELVPLILETFKLLKVFEIESLTFTRFPVSLCNVVLLKYLAISSTISSLPSTLSSLWNLQTLIVNTTSLTLEIKADLSKMSQFRHLHTNTSTILQCPSTQTQNKFVQTMCNVSPKSCTRELFYWTPKLKKLGICGTLNEILEVRGGECSLFGNICNLEILENLKLLNDDETFGLRSLPSEKGFPKQLRKLTLVNTLLEWEQMSTLGKLVNLECLKLGKFAFKGKLWHTEVGGFRHLKDLHIGHTNLVVWQAEAENFPMLRSLVLNRCDKLRSFPDGLTDIPSLQLVVLHGANSELSNSLRRFHLLKLVQAKNADRKNIFKLTVHPLFD
ncbi:OLC1v1031855C1 [Oldenlandia corymbosa var. corymbosa]|uniref:OLC1v1031855C1 n=1 Tax=Oldenlandia corymbosa var. corymbosa TaxID=529605 RepID=A0AAV1CMC5_OLDCO|nr:OLC1v1031855C1 [Oldenlandia corymbosa var. corymbosa]